MRKTPAHTRNKIFAALAAAVAALFLFLALAVAPAPVFAADAPAADAQRYHPRELREAAKGGDAEAQYRLGRMHVQGYGVTESAVAAVKWFRAAAEQGHAGAEYELGVLYTEGAEGVPKDSAEAVKWFGAAAEQGHEEALNALRAAAQGRAERRIAAQELSELRLAAESGDADAQFDLGVIYYQGRGVAQDHAEAARWSRAAAEQGGWLWGLVGAMAAPPLNKGSPGAVRLGAFYDKGRGVPQDYAEAARWWRAAAEQEDVSGQYFLGLLHREGRGVPQSYAKAAELFRAAAEQGLDMAQSDLGMAYAEGLGVAQDDAEAVKWFRAAAEQGRSTAQFNLGLMYDKGRGVAQDDAEAARWWRAAAAQGHTDAQNNLGIVQDTSRAASVRARAEAGDAEAQYKLAACIWSATASLRMKIKRRMVQAAAEQGHAGAQNSLGISYVKGRGVPQDHAEAVKWSAPPLSRGMPAGSLVLDFMTTARRSSGSCRSRQMVPRRRRAGRRRCAV
ncbi:MAG: SEL1-like repeat protein [Rhodospirillales bacterium]